MAKYLTTKDGEKFTLNWKKGTQEIACCDCGLVHTFKFTVKGSKLMVSATRHNRATGQVRRRLAREGKIIFK